MNKIFRIVWNRALMQFVVASEFCRSRAKGAQSAGGSAGIARPSMIRMAAGVALALAGTSGAYAHTTSIGYENAGNDALSFYYGTYHAPTDATYHEGSFHLTSNKGFDTTTAFTILTSTKPAGLIDGDTNFYSGSSINYLSADPSVVGQAILTWQGVTFTNLAAGTYTFTYIPIASPTQVWAPINSAILSNTVTIITSDLSTAHHIDSTEVVDQNYATDPLLLDGGTVKSTADGTMNQVVSITNANGTFDTNGHGLTLNGDIDGRGDLVKEGDGTLFLRGANTNTGDMDLNGGVVNVLNDAALGSSSSDLNFNGGTLQYGAQFDVDPARNITLGDLGGKLDTQAFDTTVAQGITGTGGLSKSGTGTLTLSGNNTYTGGTNVTEGALDVTSTGTLGNGDLNVASGANVTLNNAAQTVTGLTGAGDVALDGTSLTVDDRGTDHTFDGVLSGSGDLTKSGGGTQTLSGDNTYAGGTTITAGALQIDSDANLGDASGAVVLDGGSLHSTGDVQSARDVTVNGGALSVDDSTTFLTSGDVDGTGALVKNGGGTLEIDGTASQAGGVAVDGGTLVLAGDNTYSGDTTVNDATLQVSSDANLGDANGALILNGGSLYGTGDIDSARDISVNGDASLSIDDGKTFSTSGDIDGNAGLVKNGGGTLAIGGTASQTGGATVNDGTVILSGDNTYTGDTVINGGVLQIADDSNLGDAANGIIANGGALHVTGDLDTQRTVAIGPTADFSLEVDDGHVADLGGTVEGDGGVAKSGGGTLVLGGNNTYTGDTSVTGGTLQISDDSNLGAGGALSLDQSTLHTTADVTLDRAITLNEGTLDADAGTTVEVDGVVSGLELIKDGGGTLVLKGDNTNDATTLNDGTLQISSDSNLGSPDGTLTLNGGTLHSTGDVTSKRDLVVDGPASLDVDTSTMFTTSGDVRGTSGLVKDGGGTLEIDGTASQAGGVTVNDGTLALNGANTYTGDNQLNGGTLQVGSDSGLGAADNDIVFDGGSLHTTGDVQSARDLVLSADGDISADAGTTFATSGTVAGSGGLVKNGSGTLEIDGTASHSGGTTVNDGALVLNGANTYTGGNQLNGGTLQIGSDTNLGDEANNVEFNGGALHTTADVESARDLTLSKDATIVADAATSFVSSGSVSGVGALIKNGAGTVELDGTVAQSGGATVNAGTLILTGNNTYTGGNVINGGTLQVASDANLGDAANAVTLNGGNLTVTQSITTDRELILTAAGGSITTATDAVLNQQGNISGDGALVKLGGGTLVVSGTNLFTGGTVIDGGTIRIDSGSSLGTGDIVLKDGILESYATLGTGQKLLLSGSSGVDVAEGTTTTLSGSLITASDSGCFVKSGSGALLLSGEANLGQGTCVQDGILRANGKLDTLFVNVDSIGTLRGIGYINGPVNVSGRLAPGNSPGTLTVDGTVTMKPGSTFETDIDGTGTGTGKGNYSRLLVVGAGHQFIADGTLEPLLRGITGDASNSYVPTIGDSYRIVTAEGGIVGRFADLTQPADRLPANSYFLAFYNLGGSNSIDLRVVPTSYVATLGTAANRNTLALAGALDRAVEVQINTDAGAPSSNVLYAIGALGSDQINGALKAMSGEVHADQAAAARGNGLSIHHDVTEHLAMDSLGTAQHAWVNVTQDGQRSVADQQGSGYQANTSHLTAGVDLFANEGSVVGVGASHGQTSVLATGGRGSIQGNVGIVYARQAAGRVLLDGVASFAADDWSTRRSDPFGNGSLRTHSRGHDTMASLTTRLPVNYLQSTVEPYASVIWQKVERGAADETGESPAALTLDGFSHSGTRGVLGLAANSRQRDPLAGPTTWRVGVAAGVDSGGLLDPTVRASLAGQDFDTQAPGVARGFVQVNAGGTLLVARNTYLYGEFNTEQGSGRSAYGATAGIRVAF